MPWTEERAGLLSRVETLDRELRRVRAINENIQREWTETSSRQDAARLAEIAALKNELEKLHAHHRPA
ncbi:MAG: hypothetical protein HY926_14345 [Elusimicrobia bacterium]|nr:hypothetical protein [Elusimicrobiota bacterium]